MSLAVICTAVAILLFAPGGTRAGAETSTSSAVTVDAHYPGLANRRRVIETDAHHAALILHAGYRARIVQPDSTARVAAVTSGRSTGRDVHFVLSLIAATLLGSAAGALAVGGRRTRQLPRYTVTR